MKRYFAYVLMLVAVLVSLASGFAGVIHPSNVYAASNAAQKACAKPVGAYTSSDWDVSPSSGPDKGDPSAESACEHGYDAYSSTKGSINDSCSSYGYDASAGSGQESTGPDATPCYDGFEDALSASGSATTTSPEKNPSTAAKNDCSSADAGSSSSGAETATAACEIGYDGAQNGKSTGDTCGGLFQNTTNGFDQENCISGYGDYTNEQAENKECSSESGSALAACQYGWGLAASENAGQVGKGGGGTTCEVKYSNTTDETACEKGYQANGGKDDVDSDPNPTTTDVDGSTPTCDASGFSLSWILCPILEGAANAADGIYSNLIQPLLVTKPIAILNADGSQSNLYKAWSNFRVYGDIFLVVALLVIVFGEAIGGGVVDAYTAKKVLPRLLIAAILINLSIYIVAILVDVTNVVGGGIANLIEAPFQVSGTYQIHIGGSTGDLGMGALLTGVGAAWIGGGPLFMFLFVFLILPALLTIVAIFFTIVLRQGLIIILILVSPVAFALYCLPNTEQYFRRWWDLLARTLLVYPLIAVLFALGNVMSVTINSAAYGITGAFTSIFSAIVLFIPLFLIPYSFRIAGGLLGRFHEFATTSRKRMHQGILGDARDENSLRNKTKNRLSAQYTAAESRAIDSTKAPLPAGAGIGARTKRRLQNGRAGLINTFDGRVNERQSRHQKRANDIADLISATGNDDDTYASAWFSIGAGEVIPEGAEGSGLDGNGNMNTNKTGRSMFFDSKGRQKAESYVKSAESRANRNQREAGAALEYPVRKIQSDKDAGNWRRAFAATALRQKWDDGEMQGVLAAAAFKHKDKFPSLYYEKPRLVPDANGNNSIQWDDSSNTTGNGLTDEQKTNNLKARTGIANELHKTRQSFQLGTLRDEQLRGWDSERNRIQNALNTSPKDVSDQDLRFYGQTNEILDSLVQRGVVTREGDAGAEMASSGASPAAQGVLKSLMNNRRYELSTAQTGQTVAGSSAASVDQRLIYNKDEVSTAMDSSRPITRPAVAYKAATADKPEVLARPAEYGSPAISRDEVIEAQRLAGRARTIDVTDNAERSLIPRDT